MRPRAAESRQGRPINPLESRLGRRLLGWFIVISLLPLMASNMLGYIESGRLIERFIGRQLAAIASVQATYVRDQIDWIFTRLDLLVAANPEFREAIEAGLTDVAAASLSEELSRKLDEAWEFDALFIEGPDGAVRAVAGDAEWVTERARTMVPQPAGASLELLDQRSRAGRPIIRLTVPLSFRRDGAPEGRLGALVGSQSFASTLDIPPHLAGSIESFVLDASDRPLLVSHPHGFIDYSLPIDIQPVAGEPDAMRYPDRLGTEVFGLAMPIEGLRWKYLVELPVSDALGPLRLLRRLSLIFGTLFGLVVIGAAWFVSGNIVAPVRELAEAAELVGAGELHTSIEVSGDDEIGDLGVAFDRMTRSLEQARDREAEAHAREIRRAQQLATVGELASGVAHEIKNPVAGIAGGLDLVRRRLGGDDSLRPILDEMSAQTDRIGAAIRDLLTFARPPRPRFGSVRPARIVERAITLVQPAAERARVELRSDSDVADTQPVRVDAELLRQALVNLSVNAVQATPPGGVVTISVDQSDVETRFRVSDTGKGIPKDRLQAIFRPFFTTRHSGSGLGLSISRDIIERHGGTIDVESEPGSGTTFTIRIPRADAEATR